MTSTPRALRALPEPEPEQTGVTLREPGDLVALVPYLLHFHPEESVVAVFFQRAPVEPRSVTARQRRVNGSRARPSTAGLLKLTARFDLPDTDTAAPILAREVDRVGRHVGADQVALLGYGEHGSRRSFLEAMVRSVRLEVVDALWVHAGRWWSLTCTSEDCCPSEGRAYDPSSHPLAAEAVLAGMNATACRASITELAAGPPRDRHPELSERAAQLETELNGTRRTRQRRVQQTVREFLRRGTQPSEVEALTLAVLVTDVLVRDVAFAAMTRSTADDHLRVWQAVVGQVPDELAAAPLTLMAIAGWLSGNGALLNACVDRLAVVDPTYSMGKICAGIADRALPPDAWEEMRPGFALTSPR